MSGVIRLTFNSLILIFTLIIGVIAVISPEEQEVFESDLRVTFMIIVLGIRQINVPILFYTQDGSAKCKL